MRELGLIVQPLKVENPAGVEACLPNRSPDEVYLSKNWLRFAFNLFGSFNFFGKRKCAQKNRNLLVD
jgi:hypothetical protein